MSWVARLWNTFRAGRVQREIDREVAFHLSERADELRASGLTGEEAARRARLLFGSVTIQAERTRDTDIVRSLDAFLRNLRYAVRTMRRAPGFTAAVVLTLALGIGANTAVFSAIDAVLLKPLGFPDAGRLVRVRQMQERTAETNIAPSRLEDWNRLSSTFESITGYYVEDASETSGDFPERIRRAWVAPRFFEVWGIPPVRGRAFTDAEHLAGGPSAVVIGDRYWRRRFGSDPNVVGKTIRIANTSFAIVGVMPAAFPFPDRRVDIWFPVAMSPSLAPARQATWYAGIGRLKPGITSEQARANLSVVQAQLAERYPDTDRTIRADVVPLKEEAVGGVRASLWLLFGAVSLLLLVACTNIAALLLSRATHRWPEISVRLALGASRTAVAAQMLTETAVLAAVGGAIGLAVAAAAAAAFRSAAADLPRVDEIVLDGRILLYTFVTTVGVALMCGLLPAIRAGRGRLAGANDAARPQVSRRNSVQWLLVGTQVALSVTLLAGAALLVRSFQQLSRVNPGFEPTGVLTFRVSGYWNETVNYDRLLQRIDGTLERLKALPGVAGAATAIFLPGMPAQYESTFELAEAESDADRRLIAESRVVSPEYFATLQIPVMSGDLCGRHPIAAARDVMVNRTFANRYLARWPSVIGLHVSTGSSAAPPARIVGVVGDARERGLDRVPGPTVYTCFSAPNPTPAFLVRASGDPASIAHAMRLTIKEFEPYRAVYDIAPLEERIGAAFAQNRLRTLLLVYFAVTALLLSCVGLYGTLSYIVTLRRREVGLRLALGAGRADIIRQFLQQALRVVGVACACGLSASLALGRVVSGMLYGVSPYDPRVLLAVVGLVLIVATLAAIVPATRAALVAPMQVLRED